MGRGWASGSGYGSGRGREGAAAECAHSWSGSAEPSTSSRVASSAQGAPHPGGAALAAARGPSETYAVFSHLGCSPGDSVQTARPRRARERRTYRARALARALLAPPPSHEHGTYEHGTYEGCSGQAALCLGLGGYAQRGCGAVWRCMALRLDGCRHGRPCVSAVLSRRPRSTEGKTSDAESSAACHAPESAPRRAAAPPGVPRPCSVGGAATCLGLG